MCYTNISALSSRLYLGNILFSDLGQSYRSESLFKILLSLGFNDKIKTLGMWIYTLELKKKSAATSDQEIPFHLYIKASFHHWHLQIMKEEQEETTNQDKLA